MGVPITLAYGGALGVWFFVLSLRVIQGRLGPSKPGLGDGGNAAMLRVIRGHANFAEYVPIILVLMGMLELGGTPHWVIHALGGSLLVGRLLHGYALSFTANHLFGRSAGIALTLIVLLVAGVLAIVMGVQG